MNDSPIRDVSDTAFMVAAYRARESARPGALFHDPLAERLAGETPRCALERIRVDLGDTSARRAALSQAAAHAKKTLVLTEGVVPYLTEEQTAALADDLKRQPSVIGWIVDYFSAASYRYRRRSGMAKSMEKAPFRFEPADYFAFFAARGWRPKETRYLTAEGTRLGRPFPLPVLMKVWLRLIRPLIPPERLEAMNRFAGFVLFEPAP